MGFLSDSISSVLKLYSSLTSSLSPTTISLGTVLFFSLVIVFYSIFTWKFYKSLSKKDLLSLNLSQYNRSVHPFLNKLFATFLYLVEYVIILPFLIFFWFAILALIILILSENQDLNQVIIISAAMVAAIRILSYYTEELSKDLAKVFPLTILTIFLLNPEFFSFERLLTNLNQIPKFLTSILFYLILIIILEVLLRVIETITHFFKTEEEENTENQAP